LAILKPSFEGYRLHYKASHYAVLHTSFYFLELSSKHFLSETYSGETSVTVPYAAPRPELREIKGQI
jgi:hypothetical protein